MLVQAIESPIIIFSLDDLGIEKKLFLVETDNAFKNLPWDLYDMRRAQLNFIQNTIPENIWNQVPLQLKIDYYLGKLPVSAIEFLFAHLVESDLEKFKKIKPFRKRSIAEFLLNYENNWQITRIPANQFSQIDAQIEDNKLDYRKYPRIFAESSEEIVNNKFFLQLLCGVANTLKSSRKEINKLNIVAHHTYVEATHEQEGDNSPEGIHQDGYDYIVSAFVVERNNIIGGVSQIFGADKKTKLLSIKLMPGQGVLQQDKGSCLWHNVTAFSVQNNHSIGYRTSIGFDINIVQ